MIFQRELPASCAWFSWSSPGQPGIRRLSAVFRYWGLRLCSIEKRGYLQGNYTTRQL